MATTLWHHSDPIHDLLQALSEARRAIGSLSLYRTLFIQAQPSLEFSFLLIESLNRSQLTWPSVSSQNGSNTLFFLLVLFQANSFDQLLAFPHAPGKYWMFRPQGVSGASRHLARAAFCIQDQADLVQFEDARSDPVQRLHLLETSSGPVLASCIRAQSILLTGVFVQVIEAALSQL